MSESITPDERHERAIATLLCHGTGMATFIIGVGATIQWLRPSAKATLLGLSGLDLMKAGIALFILLPVFRVCLMFVLFLRERDNTYAAISALVLAIIGAAFLVCL